MLFQLYGAHVPAYSSTVFDIFKYYVDIAANVTFNS